MTFTVLLFGVAELVVTACCWLLLLRICRRLARAALFHASPLHTALTWTLCLGWGLLATATELLSLWPPRLLGPPYSVTAGVGDLLEVVLAVVIIFVTAPLSWTSFWAPQYGIHFHF